MGKTWTMHESMDPNHQYIFRLSLHYPSMGKDAQPPTLVMWFSVFKDIGNMFGNFHFHGVEIQTRRISIYVQIYVDIDINKGFMS